MWNKYTAAFIGALMLAGCQIVEEEIINEEPQEVISEEVMAGYTLTVEAARDVDTKALSLSGSTLNAYWRNGEKVAVYLGGTKLGMLEATVNAMDNKKATLAGTLDSVDGVAENSVLTLLYPRANWDYTGQNGELSTYSLLSSVFDFAMASVTVATVDNVNMTITTTGNASFVNQQSIYRFGFLVNGAGEKISIKGFTVSSAHNALVRTRTWGAGDWIDNTGPISVTSGNSLTLPYASLRNTLVGTPSQAQIDAQEIIDTYYFSVIGSDGALYLGSKGIPAQVMDTHGKFIGAQSISVTKTDNMAKSGTATEVW